MKSVFRTKSELHYQPFEAPLVGFVRYAVLLLVYFLGVCFLDAQGPLSTGTLWLLAFSVLAAVMMGSRAGLAAAAVSAATLVALTLLDNPLRPRLGADQAPHGSLQQWIVTDASFFAMSLVILWSLQMRVRRTQSGTVRPRSALEPTQQLARAVEQASELIFITDVDGNLQYINPAFAGTSGLDADHVRGQGLHQVGVFERGAIDEAAIWAQLRSGKPWKGRVRTRRRDGTPYEAEVSLSPIREEENAVGHVVGMLRDVTREHELQQHLQRAQKLEAIGTLAAGIAHDFNNVLVPIMANAEFVRDRTATGSSERADLDEVIKAGERASALVRRILSFSRQVHTQRQPMTLGPLVSETAKLLRASLPSTVEMRLRIEAHDAQVTVEPAEIQQILLNLCTNAAHAMREHGGVLLLGLDVVDSAELTRPPPAGLVPAAKYVRLQVDDTGCGIAPEHLERIFDPFFTTKNPGEGTGLGLAMVHAIVTSLGGAVTVSSIVGEGTHFEVYLPADPKAAADAEEWPEAPPEGAGRRVLLIDDEPAIVLVCRRLLDRWGFEVIVAPTAPAALALLRDSHPPPAALLTDLTMPQMDGITLAEAARQLIPDIAVVVMSGVINEQSETRLRGLGVDGILAKPFSPRQLAEVLGRALRTGALDVAPQVH